MSAPKTSPPGSFYLYSQNMSRLVYQILQQLWEGWQCQQKGQAQGFLQKPDEIIWELKNKNFCFTWARLAISRLSSGSLETKLNVHQIQFAPSLTLSCFQWTSSFLWRVSWCSPFFHLQSGRQLVQQRFSKLSTYLATQQNLFRMFWFFVLVQAPELQIIKGHVWTVKKYVRKYKDTQKRPKNLTCSNWQHPWKAELLHLSPSTFLSLKFSPHLPAEENVEVSWARDIRAITFLLKTSTWILNLTSSPKRSSFAANGNWIEEKMSLKNSSIEFKDIWQFKITGGRLWTIH